MFSFLYPFSGPSIVAQELLVQCFNSKVLFYQGIHLMLLYYCNTLVNYKSTPKATLMKQK